VCLQGPRQGILPQNNDEAGKAKEQERCVGDGSQSRCWSMRNWEWAEGRREQNEGDDPHDSQERDISVEQRHSHAVTKQLLLS